jgi:hypothetical protein
MTGIATELCPMADWMDKTVKDFGCDALYARLGSLIFTAAKPPEI